MTQNVGSANVSENLKSDASVPEKRTALRAAGVQVAARGKLSATALAAYDDLVARQGAQQA